MISQWEFLWISQKTLVIQHTCSETNAIIRRAHAPARILQLQINLSRKIDSEKNDSRDMFVTHYTRVGTHA